MSDDSYFWQDDDGAIWESPRADDQTRGRCSGIPQCCIEYFVAGGEPIEGLNWEFVPCPECVRVGNRITVKLCGDLGAACICGAWSLRKPAIFDDMLEEFNEANL